MAARSKLYKLHQAFGKHAPKEIMAVINKGKKHYLPIYMCSCGLMFSPNMSTNVGKSNERHVYKRWDRFLNEGWMDEFLNAVKHNREALKAYNQMPYPTDKKSLRFVRCAEKRAGIKSETHRKKK